jgi:hypothetical protein
VSKANQFQLLKTNSELLAYLPETTVYNKDLLSLFLNRYAAVYVKHSTAGQGRGVFKVWRNDNGDIGLSGFNIHGIESSGIVKTVEEFDYLLQPFRSSTNEKAYILQEAVNSSNLDGVPVSFRVHVQKMKHGWVIGGTKGATGSGVIIDNGILNRNRGSITLPTYEVLENVLGMTIEESKEATKLLEKVSIMAAETMAVKYACREFGIDFGVENGIPKIFEMNTQPSIVAFSLLEDKSIWKQIVANRKAQNQGL